MTRHNSVAIETSQLRPQPVGLGQVSSYRISVTSLIAPRTMPKPTCLRQARR
jgi:hypothetical protein